MLKVLLYDAIRFFVLFLKDRTAVFLNVYFIILYIKMKDNGTIHIMAVNLMVHFFDFTTLST